MMTKTILLRILLMMVMIGNDSAAVSVSISHVCIQSIFVPYFEHLTGPAINVLVEGLAEGASSDAERSGLTEAVYHVVSAFAKVGSISCCLISVSC